MESDSDESELNCKICLDPKSVEPNQIVICDKCEQGYHQRCHSPTIPSTVLIPEICWVCKQCFYSLTTDDRIKFDIFKHIGYQPISNELPAENRIKLTYELNKLTWDKEHLINNEDIYCYCGRGLDYYRSLLQCFTCKQWFHLTCIKSIDYELLIGDQYFKFICSVCNGGTEICNRITMKWKAVVGLVLSNLTYGSDERFFHIQEIIAYLIENEEKFKLSVRLDKLGKEELIKKIETNLKENPDKFLCKNEKWCLNIKFPYVDPLTYSPYHENLESTFAFQKSADNRPSSASSNRLSKPVAMKIPDGACRKNASNQPIKVNQFKKSNDPTKRRYSTDDISINNFEKYKKSRRHSNSLLRSKHETCSNSSKSSSSNDIESPIRPTSYLEEKNLQLLDSVIPFPNNFDGINNPFYSSPKTAIKKETNDSSKREHNHCKSSNNRSTNLANSTSTCNQKNSSLLDKVEYRVVNNKPNKLVLTRVSSENSMSTTTNAPISPINSTSTNSTSNNSSFSNGTLNSTINHTSSILNNTVVKLNGSIKDDKKNFKILGTRTNHRGITEYMLECTTKEKE